ncbi:hypothetical protein V6N11_047608 [Hibiscus sabdariffa]|uniref:23 kDa jasmonate-induced protein-like n=1 Tax=Hibiscus sabdariffa TaxID=183260 RepID=A0ABR2NKZ6_9ROSI
MLVAAANVFYRIQLLSLSGEPKRTRNARLTSRDSRLLLQNGSATGNAGAKQIEMAYVFGNAVTDATLRAMPRVPGEEDNPTRQSSCGPDAENLRVSDGKDVTVRQQVENLTAKAAGGERATICLIYNATGDTLTLVTYQDWSGHVGSSSYPPLIGNGQWGVFLHVGDESAAYSSVGAVVYRRKNKDGQDRDWMQAWSNTRKANKAYSEVQGVSHQKYKDAGVWGVVAEKNG